jgi:hypothetical protein
VTSESSWGECYFDHYVKTFKVPPQGREVFEGVTGQKLQVLWFDALPGCRIFATVGLTHFSQEIGSTVELVGGAETSLASIPSAFANVLFLAVEQRIQLREGVSITGLQRACPEFVARHQKPGVYFARPNWIAAAATHVHCGEATGHLLDAVFISRAEYDFLCEHGSTDLEARVRSAEDRPFQTGSSFGRVEVVDAPLPVSH